MTEPVTRTAPDSASRVATTPLDPGLFLALAPMDGITDWASRQALTDVAGGHSGISLCASEFVRVTAAPVVDKVLLRECPELREGGQTRAGIPVYVQLLGGEPTPMARSARRAAQLGAPGIDLNFGCPAKTVNRHDGGATLLKRPQRIAEVVDAVRQALPDAVVVSVKVRLGWEDRRDVEAVAQAAERGGAAWLTVHGRTRTEMYGPPADWNAIGVARRAVSIPVVANGDLRWPSDLASCAADSGCDAFMIGRAATAHHDLFRRMRGWPGDASPDGYRDFLRAYLRAALVRGVPEPAAVGRLKHWVGLAAVVEPARRTLFAGLKRLQSAADAFAWLDTAASSDEATLQSPALPVHAGCREVNYDGTCEAVGGGVSGAVGDGLSGIGRCDLVRRPGL